MEFLQKKIVTDFLIPVIRDTFVISLCTFVFYFFADMAKPGLVTNYVNLNVLLLFVFFAGIVTILLQENNANDTN
ncbi:MAG: hypothetical protein HZB10_00590 [Candidatus Yonathbacteria bacterium]|nr:hypothetical protein [Candidatus Yonathbacteria bacterium]